jgi:hypothetical protein
VFGRQSVVALGLLAFGAIYASEYLGLSSRWWYADDPSLFAYCSTIHNPASIFTDRAVVGHFTSGATLVPMQLLSYWVDVRLAGFSPQFAYAHQVCSFSLTLLLFYLILARALPGARLAALAASLVWALLPATAVVVQYLSTRHYLEGLLFGGLSLYLAERMRQTRRGFHWPLRIAVVSCASVARLFKEIYAPVVPILLLASAWRRRDWKLAALTAATALGYAYYRWWVLGWNLQYGNIPFLTPWQYLKFLSKVPYTLTANYGGYCLFGAVTAMCLYVALRRKGDLGTILCLLLVAAVSLAAIVPVSYPLYGTIRTPATSYRFVFLLHTLIVALGACLAARIGRRWLHGAIVLVALAALLPGLAKTRDLWSGIMASAEREGKFYLANPDKTLLSEEEAWWFIPGINWMYGVRPPHYVLVKDLATTPMPPGAALWRFADGRFSPDYHWQANPPRVRPNPIQ